MFKINMDYVENVHNHKKHMEIFQFIILTIFSIWFIDLTK